MPRKIGMLAQMMDVGEGAMSLFMTGIQIVYLNSYISGILLLSERW